MEEQGEEEYIAICSNCGGGSDDIGGGGGCDDGDDCGDGGGGWSAFVNCRNVPKQPITNKNMILRRNMLLFSAFWDVRLGRIKIG